MMKGAKKPTLSQKQWHFLTVLHHCETRMSTFGEYKISCVTEWESKMVQINPPVLSGLERDILSCCISMLEYRHCKTESGHHVTILM